MRVVLDTNVVVSAFLSPTGTPGRLIDAWKNETFDLVVSPEILAEYNRALRYPRVAAFHGLDDTEIDTIVADFARVSILVRPRAVPRIVEADPADNVILGAAEAGRVEYVVTGDRDLLRLERHRQIEILSPAAFLILLRRNEGI